jgi:hypothetical protein
MQEPWDWAIRRAEDWPCSNAAGIVRNADVPSSPPRRRSALQFDADSPAPRRPTAAIRPYVSICYPAKGGVRGKNQARAAHHHLQKFPLGSDPDGSPAPSIRVGNGDKYSGRRRLIRLNRFRPDSCRTTCNYRFDGTFQAEYFFLEQVQRPRLAAVAGESGGTGRVDAVDPSIQFRLTRSLQ